MSVESDNPKRDRPKEGRVPDETQVPKQDESEGGIARTGEDEDYEK